MSNPETFSADEVEEFESLKLRQGNNERVINMLAVQGEDF
jgi:hypothetical protein